MAGEEISSGLARLSNILERAVHEVKMASSFHQAQNQPLNDVIDVIKGQLHLWEHKNLKKIVQTWLDKAEKAISTTSTSNTKTASVVILTVSPATESSKI